MIFFESLTHPLVQTVACACQARGNDVIDILKHGGLRKALESFGAPAAFVLTPPERCEARALRTALEKSQSAFDLGAAILDDARLFLSNCRLATQAMMPRKAGHVLFLGIDDVAARFAGLPETPIANQLRVSGLKSLAKEYGHMKIRYNAIISQPSKESVDPEIWREQRGQMKIYSMKYSPYKLDDYTIFCVNFISSNFPVNGGLLCLGKGVMEMAS